MIVSVKRKYFGTDGIRGEVGGSVINPEFVLKLGWAAGKVLGEHGHSKVLIGKDTRISGYMLESALEAGLSAAGVDSHLMGPMPTPAVAYLTRTFRANAGIMISASHNPYYDNGIKFFSPEGTKLLDEFELAIEAQLDKPLVVSAKLGKATRIVDAPGRYIEFCKSTIAKQVSLHGLKIVLDCANGAGYHVAPPVLRELGAEVIVIAGKPDGLNINEQCGATQPQVLQQRVLAEHADLGIAIDGDGDRVIMVDSQGDVVDGDQLLYIIAQDYQALGSLTGVVGTVMSNLGLELALQELGIAFTRTQVGDRYVIEKMQATAWPLGGETSGHIICSEKSMTGDGMISALQVLAAMCRQGKALHELKKGMYKFPHVLVNVRLPQLDSDPLQAPAVQKAIKQVETQLANSGRVLLRRSGTEPVVRIMVEGSDAGLVDNLAGQLAECVRQAC
jgi:phosphoglucosamine mutase